MLVELSLKLLYSIMCGKNFHSFQIYGVHDPRKCIDSRYFHSCLTPPPPPLTCTFLSSRPMLKEITYSPRQYSFENLFPPAAERGGGIYYFLYQNSIRKYEDDLGH